MNSIPFVVENVASTLALSGYLCGRERTEGAPDFLARESILSRHTIRDTEADAAFAKAKELGHSN